MNTEKNFKQCKTHTNTGRPVARFTCYLKFPDGTKRTYRSDVEHKKMVAQGLLHPNSPEHLAVIRRFEEYAYKAVEAYIFDNRPEMQNDNVRVKAVFGKIVKNDTKYFQNMVYVVPPEYQRYYY